MSENASPVGGFASRNSRNEATTREDMWVVVVSGQSRQNEQANSRGDFPLFRGQSGRLCFCSLKNDTWRCPPGIEFSGAWRRSTACMSDGKKLHSTIYLLCVLVSARAQTQPMAQFHATGPYLNHSMPEAVAEPAWSAVPAFPHLLFTNAVGLAPLPGTSNLL